MSDLPGTSSAPADDFIHVNLEKSTNSLVDSFSSNKSQYCQVVFHDLSEVYPTDGDICFTYSFQPGVIPQARDRIALYKVGWSSVSEFIYSVFPDPPEEGLPFHERIYKISFPVENLPKDEVNMYQFCYVTSGNIVAGSSIPFTFRKPHGSELVAVEDPNDSGLVVFRSRVTQLQEQLYKSNADKENLEKTIQELKSELYLLKAEITKKAEKCDLHKSSIHDMTTVIYDLNTEKKELLGKLEKSAELAKQVEKLESCRESLEGDIQKLKCSMEILQNDIVEKDISIMNLNEQLEKSSEKCQQLEGMQKIKDDLESDLSRLNTEMKLLQNDLADKEAAILDLTESKKILEERNKALQEELKIAGEKVEEITKTMKIQELSASQDVENLNKKLREVYGRNNSTAAECISLTKDLEKANNQVKNLEDLVKTKDRVLKDYLESSNSTSDQVRRLFSMEDENALLHVQVVSMEEKLVSLEDENKKLKEEVEELLAEKIRMADQLSKMNEIIRGYNSRAQHQQGDGQRQQDQQGPTPRPRCPGSSQNDQSRSQSTFAQFSQFLPFFTPFQGVATGGGASVNISASCDTPQSSTSTPSTCEKCPGLERKVKQLMVEKSDVRSDLIQLRHSNDEYCRHLREVNEEAAALKSRVAVLEIELRKAKELSITNQAEQKFKNVYDALSNSWRMSEPMETSCEFKASDFSAYKQLQDALAKELETKALLQRNVEALMIRESKDFVAIHQLKKENLKLVNEISSLKEKLATAEELRKALDDGDLSKSLQAITAENEKLKKQLIDLRKESVGKVSLTTFQQLRDENEQLKNKLTQDSLKKLKEEGVGTDVGTSTSAPTAVFPIPTAPVEVETPGYSCPVCNVVFPPDSIDAFNKHISDHFD